MTSYEVPTSVWIGLNDIDLIYLKAAVAKILDTDTSMLALYPLYGGMTEAPRTEGTYSRMAIACCSAIMILLAYWKISSSVA